jgi:ubiquinone/menaquinone biosynthesis C-methylase UbiE
MTNNSQSTLEFETTQSEWVKIHNNAAHDYKIGEWSREVFFGMRDRRKKLFSRATGNVLDVACGYGMNFSYLANATSIHGVDFSPVMLKMANDRVRALNLRVALSEGDAEALDFPDNTFDTVITALSTCSFLHPIKALQEMRRVCKPGGRILLIEHGRSDWELLGRYQDRHVADMLKQSGCRWNQEPPELVQEAGLDILTAQRNFFGVFHTIEALPAKNI